MTPVELAARFVAEDARAVEAVRLAGADVARAIELAARALEAGGRILVLGAGTSGRLAVMEASECRPTFSSDRVVALMAGGPDAFVAAREGAEDDHAAGKTELSALRPDARDLVLGVAASGRTPWVQGALEAARAAGAATGLVCCAPPGEAMPPRDVTIVLDTGPEALSGSTRMKAGTATKCALNAITTGAMARAGKVMDDLMVDVSATNMKLRARARRIVATLVPTDDAGAAALLERAAGEVSTSVVCGRLGLAPDAARARLAAHGGHLRRALAGSDGGAPGAALVDRRPALDGQQHEGRGLGAPPSDESEGKQPDESDGGP